MRNALQDFDANKLGQSLNFWFNIRYFNNSMTKSIKL